MMLGNYRHLVFILRVSVVINMLVLLYAAVHLTSSTVNNEYLVPTAAGMERSLTLGYQENLGERIDTYDSLVELSQILINKTKTTTVADLEKNMDDDENNDIEPTNENVLSEKTLERLKSVLECRDRKLLPRTMQRGEYWVLQNFVRAEHGALRCHESITYTTHAGFEFLDNITPLVERWVAPISVAVHAPGSDLMRTVDSIRFLRDCAGTDLIRKYVTFHVFFSDKHIPKEIPKPDIFLKTSYECSKKSPLDKFNMSATYTKEKGLLYPVNVARNVARDAALTHFIFASDIELYPSPNLVPQFLNMYARKKWNSNRPRIFPISIFEVDAKVNVPSSKTELQQMLHNKSAIPFHKFLCNSCHKIPQAQQWINAPETKKMDVFHVGKRRGQFLHWEPIFIGTHDDPYYDERLSWEGKKDKMTQGYILCVKDYDFMILNNAFLCHKPGIKHYKKNAKRDLITAKQNSYLNNIVMPELRKLFGTRNGCTL